MGSADSAIDPFEDLAWLRRFALRLTRDEDEADDLVQETLMEAWRKPPAHGGRSLRPWLASVLRNRGRMAHRAQERRRRRERIAFDPPHVEVEPEAEQARLQVLEQVVAQLRRLPADDRRIVVRRYVDGESAAEIARELSVPAATIRSRLSRTLRRIRAALDDRYGDRGTWCAALVPGLGGGATFSAPAASKSSMSLTTKILLVSGAFASVGATAYLVVPARTTVTVATPKTAAARRTETTHAVAGPAAEAAASSERAEASDDDGDDPVLLRKRWQERRASIRAALHGDDPEAAQAAADGIRARKRAYRERIAECVADLGPDTVGTITLALREVGAPDIGTIYDTVEIAHTSIDDPDLLTCVQQSMYAYVGEAPEAPEMGVSTLTMPIGKPLNPDQKARQVTDYIFGAHIGEVRFCQKKSEEVRGDVEYALMVAGGDVTAAVPGPTAIPKPVVDCITQRIRKWRFPDETGTPTLRVTLSLPIVDLEP